MNMKRREFLGTVAASPLLFGVTQYDEAKSLYQEAQQLCSSMQVVEDQVADNVSVCCKTDTSEYWFIVGKRDVNHFPNRTYQPGFCTATQNGDVVVSGKVDRARTSPDQLESIVVNGMMVRSIFKFFPKIEYLAALHFAQSDSNYFNQFREYLLHRRKVIVTGNELEILKEESKKLCYPLKSIPVSADVVYNVRVDDPNAYSDTNQDGHRYKVRKVVYNNQWMLETTHNISEHLDHVLSELNKSEYLAALYFSKNIHYRCENYQKIMEFRDYLIEQNSIV